MRYRPEIDGLRTVAVLPVILFHAGLPYVTGGFIGVDIFFVISGYLITTILLDDIDAGRFSIRRFYERRMRRIFPALFVVALATSIAGWAWLMPADLRDTGKSLIGVALFMSNYVFWRDLGYFHTGADLRPLLHTWSLAVEEQYYVVMPLLLAVLARFAWQGRFAVVAGLFALSLAACLISQPIWPDLTFYSIHTRAWELLAGSLCAMALRRHEFAGSQPLSMLGLGLIVAGFLVIDETMPFPSVWALMPVLGTGLIILFARPQTLVARFLSLRLMVGIGLISYSVYLWHQPILAFARLSALHTISTSVLAVVVMTSLPLGYLSWRFVEAPFRRGTFARSLGPRGVLGMVAAGTAVMLAAALTFYVTNGLPGRVTGTGARFADLHLEEQLAVNLGLDQNCIRGFTLDDRCATGPNPEVLVWGDSYAMHIVRAVAASLAPGEALRQMTSSSCTPVWGLTMVSSAAATNACRAFNDRVMDWLATAPGIRTVVMSSPFSAIVTPSLQVDDAAGNRMDATMARGIEAMRATVTRLHELGLGVVIVSPPPNPGWNIGRCLGLSTLAGLGLGQCDFGRDALSDPIELAYTLLRGVEDLAPVVWLDAAICPDGHCLGSTDGIFVYRDRGHLSLEGTRWLGRNATFRADLQAALARPVTP